MVGLMILIVVLLFSVAAAVWSSLEFLVVQRKVKDLDGGLPRMPYNSVSHYIWNRRICQRYVELTGDKDRIRKIYRVGMLGFVLFLASVVIILFKLPVSR